MAKAIAVLGDVDFLSYGGAVVYEDGDMDVIEPSEQEGGPVTVSTIHVDPYSPSEWWAKSLPAIARTSGIDQWELRMMLASKDLKERASAFYFAVLPYYGAYEFDQYPVKLTAEEAEVRYAGAENL